MNKEELVELFKKVIYSSIPLKRDEVDLSSFPEAEQLLDDLISLRDFILCMVNGHLKCSMKVNGCIAGGLKALQSNFKHLIWQTKKIADGDLSQRVDFMGDFSEAFNYMAERFSDGIELLQNRTQELKESNEALMQEIQSRKETEKLLEESNERYKVLATQDPLTGLFNRRYFMSMGIKELSRSRRHSLGISFVMFDIDFFKRVNDMYGHSVGDGAIKHVANILKSNMRTEDLICRYGGEEFLVLMPDTSLKGAIAAVENIRKKIEKTPCLFNIENEDKDISITVSGGLVEADMSNRLISVDESLEKILSDYINEADKALYQAKENGRNRVYYIKDQEFFNASPEAEALIAEPIS